MNTAQTITPTAALAHALHAALEIAKPDEQLSGRQYTLLQSAFDFFNVRLFAGELPQVLITLHRHKRAVGYFSPECYTLRDTREDRIIHEIALNPDRFIQDIPTDRSLSTLVHEMAHLWQQEFGKKNSRKCYHNREWADKMEEVGLMPSTTGQQGGKRTGQSCSHYIIENGPFAKACARFLEKAGNAILVNAVPKFTLTKARDKSKNKVCFECLTCKQKAWAKPTAKLDCGTCNRPMLSNDPAVE